MSCVAEDLGKCTDPRGNTRLTVRVTTDIDATRAGLGDYEIECAHVYVFDAQGLYVTSAEGIAVSPETPASDDDQDDGSDESGTHTRAEEDDTEYEFWLDLPGGDFDFVVWTNLGEHYRIHQTIEEMESDSLTMDDLELYLDHGGQDLTDNIPHLLHGIDHGHTIIEEIDNQIEVEIRPLTYTVNLTALNLPSGNDDYAFTITDNNSHYTFEGKLVEGKDDFTHHRTGPAPRREFNASIRTLTLSADRSPRFTFSDASTGTVMHEADLIETITRAYRAASRSVDFNTTHIYDIVLSFDAANMEFTVSVNGWEHDEIYKVLD